MTIDDETLSRYADGELTVEERASVEAALKQDPELTGRLERMRRISENLRLAYADVADEPVPERFRALIDQLEPPKVVDLAAARQRRAFGPPAWAAIAATLVVGVLAGRMSAPQELFVAQGGELRAGAALTRVLDTQLASAQADDAATRIGLSFRSEDGELCRTFSHAEGEGALSGLACREDAAWIVRVAAQGEAGGEYTQASSAAPAVLAMVDEIIDGEPMDATQEEAARDGGWRARQ